MIDISHHDHPTLYEDYEASMDFLRKSWGAAFSYPDSVTPFHIYSELLSDKEMLCLESFLATQNLDRCKLYVWSDYDISRRSNLEKYKEIVEFNVYDPLDMAKGTALEDRGDLLLAHDTKHWLRSDLLRILVTHKYGGVWSDMDVVFLRDFGPILDQEFFYQWGSDTDFANFGFCGSVMRIMKDSYLSRLLLKRLIETPHIIKDSTVWGKDLFATVYSEYSDFTIFPSTFFDPEWLVNKKHPGLGDRIESGWFSPNEYSHMHFDGSFAWHWHNSSHKNDIVLPGSKFNQLSIKTQELLRNKGI